MLRLAFTYQLLVQAVYDHEEDHGEDQDLMMGRVLIT
jgi:hypothetical protein